MNFLGKQPHLVNVGAYGKQQQIQEKSTEHSDEYGETSNVAVLDTTTVIEQSQQNVSHIDPSSNLLVAHDGTEWTCCWNKLKRQMFAAKHPKRMSWSNLLCSKKCENKQSC